MKTYVILHFEFKNDVTVTIKLPRATFKHTKMTTENRESRKVFFSHVSLVSMHRC